MHNVQALILEGHDFEAAFEQVRTWSVAKSLGTLLHQVETT